MSEVDKGKAMITLMALEGALAGLMLAGRFVTEPETWPVFAEWMRTKTEGAKGPGALPSEVVAAMSRLGPEEMELACKHVQRLTFVVQAMRSTGEYSPDVLKVMLGEASGTGN